MFSISSNGIIGAKNSIPWYYSLIEKRFDEVTSNSTVIMGHNTYMMLQKPLPNRRNIVITTDVFPNVETYGSLEDVRVACKNDNHAWIIGGKKQFERAFSIGIVDVVDVTYVPDIISWSAGNINFSTEAYLRYYVRDFSVNHPDPRLRCVRYYKHNSMDAQVVLNTYHVSLYCKGHVCSVCGKEATHNLTTTKMEDDPLQTTTQLSAYVCCEHYSMIMGKASRCDEYV